MFALAALAVCQVYGDTVDNAVSGLASRIGKVLVSRSKPRLTVLDFVDLNGRPTEFGRFLAEQLSVEFVNTPGISVVDRAHLKNILAEHKLSEEGLVNPETAKKLGQFAGVDVIVIGTITDIGTDYAVTVEGVATDTAEIVAAGRATITKTRDTQQLGSRMVSGASNSGAGVQDATQTAALATKDFGDLRVTLQSVRRTKVGGAWQLVDAIECAFDFTNRNVTQPILCAGNGEANRPNTVRAQLLNSAGDVLVPDACRGLPSVCVYGYGVSPSLIANYIMTGSHLVRSRPYYTGERLWQGSLTSIQPGETVRVSIVFGPSPEQQGQPIRFAGLHLDLELVVGTVGRGGMSDSPTSANLFVLSLDGLAVSQ